MVDDETTTVIESNSVKKCILTKKIPIIKTLSDNTIPIDGNKLMDRIRKLSRQKRQSDLSEAGTVK